MKFWMNPQEKSEAHLQVKALKFRLLRISECGAICAILTRGRVNIPLGASEGNTRRFVSGARGDNRRILKSVKKHVETGYVGYAQIPDLPHNEESEIFHCKLKSWRLKPPWRSQRTAKLTAKVPKIRSFCTGLVHFFGSRVMESKYDFSWKSGVAGAENSVKSAYF